MIAQILTRIGLGSPAAAAEDSLDTLKARGAKLEQHAADAAKSLAAAHAAVDEKQAAFVATENAYADEPSERNAKALRDAREARELAQLRTRKPQATADSTARALDAWRAEVASAEAALEQAKHAEQVDALRERATLERFNELVAEPRARLAAALAEVTAAANEIQSRWEETNAAAAELDAAGEATAKLSTLHLIAPLVRAHAEGHAQTSGGLLAALSELEHACYFPGDWSSPGRIDLARALRGPLFDEIGKRRGETPERSRAAVLGQLRAALSAPTLDQGKAAASALDVEIRRLEEEWQAAENARVLAEAAELAAADGEALEESNERRGSASTQPGTARSEATLAAELEERREGNGERQAMSRTRAHLRTQAAGDEHFSRIAPDVDHFERLNQ